MGFGQGKQRENIKKSKRHQILLAKFCKSWYLNNRVRKRFLRQAIAGAFK
jgi:hypothetical protein